MITFTPVIFNFYRYDVGLRIYLVCGLLSIIHTYIQCYSKVYIPPSLTNMSPEKQVSVL